MLLDSDLPQDLTREAFILASPDRTTHKSDRRESRLSVVND